MDQQLMIICWFDVVRSTALPRGAARQFIEQVTELVRRVFRLTVVPDGGDAFHIFVTDALVAWEVANRVWDEAGSQDLDLHGAMHIGFGEIPPGPSFESMMAQTQRILKVADPDECLVSTGARDLLRQVRDVPIHVSAKTAEGDRLAPLWVLKFGDPRLRMYRIPAGPGPQLQHSEERILSDACGSMLDWALYITGASHGSLILVDTENKKLDIVSARPEDGPDAWTDEQRQLVLGVGQGLTGWVAQNKEPILVSDIAAVGQAGTIEIDRPESEDQRQQLEAPETYAVPHYVDLHPGTQSELAVPILRRRGDVIGVINVDGKAADEFTVLDRQVLEVFATMAGKMILDGRLRQIERATDKLEELRRRVREGVNESSLRDILKGVRSALNAHQVELLMWDDESDAFVLTDATYTPTDNQMRPYTSQHSRQLTGRVGFDKEVIRTRSAAEKRARHGGPLECLVNTPGTDPKGMREPWMGVPVIGIEERSERAEGVLRLHRACDVLFYFRLFSKQEEILLANFARDLGRALTT